MAALFIFISQMAFLAPILDNADPLFALVITPGFYLHHVEVADQDPARVAIGNQKPRNEYMKVIYKMKKHFPP